MFRHIASVSALTLTLALGATAAAQGRTGTASAGAPDTSYDFEDENVLGGTYSPDGTRVDARGRALRTSLVRPRVHFVPELLKSVERL